MSSSKNLYRHLDDIERGQLETFHKFGGSVTQIAEEMHRSKSTISRELRRYTPGVSSLLVDYKARLAGQDRKRKKANSFRKGLYTKGLAKTLDKKLLVDSPRTLAHTIFEGRISTSTLYRWVEKGKLLHGDRSPLPHGKKAIWRRSHPESLANSKEEKLSIHDRDPQINNRTEFGHWEADSVLSPHSGSSSLTVLVERKTRFSYAFLSGTFGADAVDKAFIRLSRELPPGAFKSVTCDQGKEFNHYARLQEKLGIPIYFCDPHSPWQKGTVENTNGLIRRAFPKGTNFAEVSAKDLHWKALYRINETKREIVNWKSPHQCFRAECEAVLHLEC